MNTNLYEASLRADISVLRKMLEVGITLVEDKQLSDSDKAVAWAEAARIVLEEMEP